MPDWEKLNRELGQALSEMIDEDWKEWHSKRNKKYMKTSVEWLKDVLYPYFDKEDREYTNILFEKAKEMEKEQIEDAWQNGIENCGEFNNPTIVSGKQYYNQKFKSE